MLSTNDSILVFSALAIRYRVSLLTLVDLLRSNLLRKLIEMSAFCGAMGSTKAAISAT